MNENSYKFRSLEYDDLGTNVLRNHIWLSRRYPRLKPIHVPVDRKGVVP